MSASPPRHLGVKPPKAIAQFLSEDGLHLSPRRPYSDSTKAKTSFSGPPSPKKTSTMPPPIETNQFPDPMRARRILDPTRFENKHLVVEREREEFDRKQSSIMSSPELPPHLRLAMADLRAELEKERVLERSSAERVTLMAAHAEQLEHKLVDTESELSKCEHELELCKDKVTTLEEQLRDREGIIAALRRANETPNVPAVMSASDQKKSQNAALDRAAWKIQRQNELLERQRICFLTEVMDLRRKFFSFFTEKHGIAAESQEWYEWHRKIVMSPEPTSQERAEEEMFVRQPASFSPRATAVSTPRTVVSPRMDSSISESKVALSKATAAINVASSFQKNAQEAADEGSAVAERYQKLIAKLRTENGELKQKLAALKIQVAEMQEQQQKAQSQNLVNGLQEVSSNSVESVVPVPSLSVQTACPTTTSDVGVQTERSGKPPPLSVSVETAVPSTEGSSNASPRSARMIRDGSRGALQRALLMPSKIALEQRVSGVDPWSPKSAVDSVVSAISVMDKFMRVAKDKAREKGLYIAVQRPNGNSSTSLGSPSSVAMANSSSASVARPVPSVQMGGAPSAPSPSPVSGQPVTGPHASSSSRRSSQAAEASPANALSVVVSSLDSTQMLQGVGSKSSIRCDSNGSKPSTRVVFNVAVKSVEFPTDSLGDIHSIPHIPDEVFPLRRTSVYLRSLRRTLVQMKTTVQESGAVVDSSGTIVHRIEHEALREMILQMQNRINFLYHELNTANDIIELYQQELVELDKRTAEVFGISIRDMPEEAWASASGKLDVSGRGVVQKRARVQYSLADAGKDRRPSQLFFTHVISQLMDSKGTSPIHNIMHMIFRAFQARCIEYAAIWLLHPPSKDVHRLFYLPQTQDYAKRDPSVVNNCVLFRIPFTHENVVTMPIHLWTAEPKAVEDEGDDGLIMAVLEFDIVPYSELDIRRSLFVPLREFSKLMSLLLSNFYGSFIEASLPPERDTELTATPVVTPPVAMYPSVPSPPVSRYLSPDSDYLQLSHPVGTPRAVSSSRSAPGTPGSGVRFRSLQSRDASRVLPEIDPAVGRLPTSGALQ